MYPLQIMYYYYINITCYENLNNCNKIHPNS